MSKQKISQPESFGQKTKQAFHRRKNMKAN